MFYRYFSAFQRRRFRLTPPSGSAIPREKTAGAILLKLIRNEQSGPISPELNFPPSFSYRDRAVAAYNAEPAAIDAIMFRITDRAH